MSAPSGAGAASGSARWRVALPFGVVQGLDCAATLRAPAELGGFGAGFAGALAVVCAVLVPAALWARRRPGFSRRGLQALGAAVAAAGVAGLFTGRA